VSAYEELREERAKLAVPANELVVDTLPEILSQTLAPAFSAYDAVKAFNAQLAVPNKDPVILSAYREPVTLASP
jgi:hypothetical protein